MSAPDCSSTAAATDSMLSVRIGAAFGIFAVSSVGILLPILASSAKLETVFFLLRAIGAGVVLATGYVHVLGDAQTVLSDPCLGLSSTYPWPFMFATVSTLLIFFIEFMLKKFYNWRTNSIAAAAAEQQAGGTKEVEAADVEALKAEQSRAMYVAASLTFELGIIFHSIFIGITLGITSDPDTLHSLSIALCFHQFFEGLALGGTFVKAQYTTLKYIGLALAFVIVTPLGVAIGAGIGASYQTESKLALGFEGGFDSLSAGMLIYNAIADLMLPTFSEAEMPRQGWVQALGLAGLGVGAGMMALIGLWA